jgi:hypothetical protein
VEDGRGMNPPARRLDRTWAGAAGGAWRSLRCGGARGGVGCRGAGHVGLQEDRSGSGLHTTEAGGRVVRRATAVTDLSESGCGRAR